MTNPCNPSQNLKKKVDHSPDAIPNQFVKDPRYLEFDQLLDYLNKKGSELLGKVFKIDQKDYDTVYKLLV
ncbi:hypothetical protein [Desertivirga brevis]|uniref:hypothetical protein n=1 Tax=Desertivirga brevis TaxID=2810310 RepID=UPI001A97AEB8|nr:hypothetical protein [Pedobacter sp. SYSU D00873]